MLHSGIIYAATIGASAVATAGFSPLSVTLGWGLGALAGLLANKLPEQRSEIFRLPWALAVITFGAWLGENAFPQESTFPFVSLCLLLLVYYCLHRDCAGEIGRILGKTLLGVVIFLLAAGWKDISWRWPELPRLKEVLLCLLITVPWWRRMDLKWYGISGLSAVGLSLMTTGILGSALASFVEAPFYRAVQAIHIAGVLQRFEALMSGAVLLGAFSLMLYGGHLINKDASWKQNLVLIAAFCVDFGIMAVI